MMIETACRVDDLQLATVLDERHELTVFILWRTTFMRYFLCRRRLEAQEQRQQFARHLVEVKHDDS